jgi:molecular chaperone DnaK
MADTLGIDLGTTKSVSAHWLDGAPHIVRQADGGTILPSVVAFDPADGRLLAGRPAQAIAEQHPEAAITSIKRFMGRRFGDDVVRAALDRHRILYGVEESRRVRGGIEVAGRRAPPHAATGVGAHPPRAQAERRGAARPPGHAGGGHGPGVLSRLTAAGHARRGRIAGLDVLRVVNEPTAACLAYGYARLAEARRTVAVYDLGGGTFDVSVLDIGRGPLRVRATNGDTHLGGDDLDWMLVDWVIDGLTGGGAAGGARRADRLRADVHALARLRAAARAAKTALSAGEATRLQVAGRLSDEGDVADLDVPLTRGQLDAIARPFVERTLEPCRRALADARVDAAAVSEVLLVGGQTRMPLVRRAVADFFGREPDTSLPPEEVVALGAAVQAAVLAREVPGVTLADVVPLSLGVRTGETMDVVVPRGSALPFTAPAVSYSTTLDGQTAVDVRVLQGERPRADENTELAKFSLAGIQPAPPGDPEIEVTFRVDADGILEVTARDVETDNRMAVLITDSVRLSDDQIAEMVRDAEEHAATYAEQRRALERAAQARRPTERAAPAAP